VCIIAVISDEELAEKIRSALERHPEVSKDNITVLVSGGKVTLGGRVSDQAECALAEEVARSIESVNKVKNYLNVHPEGSVADAQCARMLSEVLRSINELSDAHIRVAVNYGVALLSGEVPTDDQKNWAEAMVKEYGIVSVLNELQVRSS
jgi:osmotically-inducible protein OsmY